MRAIAIRYLIVVFAVLLLIGVSGAQTPAPRKKPGTSAPQTKAKGHAELASDIQKVLQDPSIPADIRSDMQKFLVTERCEASIESTENILRSVGFSAERIKQWSEAKRKEPGCGASGFAQEVAFTVAIEGGRSGGGGCPKIANIVDPFDYVASTGIGATPVTLNGDEYLLPGLNTKGQQIEGPRNVVVEYVNRLRFNVDYSIDQVVVQNPVIPTSFFPAIATSGSAGGGRASRQPFIEYRGDDPGALFAALVQCKDAMQEDVNNQLVAQAIDLNAKIAAAQDAYTKLLEQYSSAVLTEEQATNLIAAVNGAKTQVSAAIKTGYPISEAREAKVRLDELQAAIDGYASGDKFKEWLKSGDHQAMFNVLKSQLSALTGMVQSHLAGGDAAKSATANQVKIAFWSKRINDFATITQPSAGSDKQNLSSLVLLVPGDCSTVFGTGKDVNVSFAVADLYSNTSQTQTNVVTVKCAPLLAVTGGFGFSTLHQRTAAFLPGKNASGGLENQITFTDKSNFRPVFAALLNAHFIKLTPSWTLQGAVGTGVSSRGDTTNIEFLAGLGATYKRVIYVTPAFHLGKVNELTGGFKEGDPQGSLQQPPVRSSWRPGFALVLTFPLPPSK